MYGKFFSSAFTGSMVGAGADVFAVWAYVIAHAKESCIELNPILAGTAIGMTPAQVEAAILFLCSPDPLSRNPSEDGRRLVREGQFQFRVVSHDLYRAIRNEDERRTYNRTKQRESRARRLSNGKSTLSAQSEAEAETEAEEDSAASSTPLRGYEDLALRVAAASPEENGTKAENRRQVAGLVASMASKKKLRTPAADWRPAAWDDARAIGRDNAQATELMELAGWLRKRGVRDRLAIQRVFRAVVQGQIRNPMAYFAANGAALNAITGQVAVERAEHEHTEIKRTERAFLAGAES